LMRFKTSTGAYLVEVLKRINATLQAQGGDGLLAHKVKLAALSRVFGFEIMPAPFVVAHLQLGLYLQNLGAPLAEETPTKKGERAGVYLTNALTGWEPPRGPKKQLAFPQMEEERDAAEEVKRDRPILVILGNPPYNAFAGVSATAEKILVEPYKEGLVSRWGIKKFNLDDLYVRFFGLAERRIAQMTGRGVVSYISMNTWISEPSLVVLRQRLLTSFDRFWVDNMHGDRTISEYAPDGGQAKPFSQYRDFLLVFGKASWFRFGSRAVRGTQSRKSYLGMILIPPKPWGAGRNSWKA
jgi:predicted helicase